MSFYLCGNYVTEDVNEHYISYIFVDNRFFYNTLFQIIKKSEDYFVPCYKIEQNGQIKIIYDVNRYRNINSINHVLSEGQFKRIVASFVSVIKKIESIGYVQMDTICIDSDKIFIDMDDYSVRLLCIPISVSSTWESQEQFKKNAVNALSNVIYNSSYINSSNIYSLFCDCRNDMVEFDELYEKMLCGHYGEFFWKDETMAMSSLVLLSDNKKIIIDKYPFVIGKSSDETDYTLADSKMVSRIHCRIEYDKGEYFIVDMASTNGTCVNNVRIPSEKMIPIHNGDKITIADLDYIVS